MTPEEAVRAIRGIRGVDLSTSPGGYQQAVRRIVEACSATVQANETRRCAAIFKRYVQARGDAWGLGASNPPKASDYLNEITGGLKVEETDGILKEWQLALIGDDGLVGPSF